MLLLNALLGITATCSDQQCKDGLSLSIDFTADIKASTTVAAELYDLDTSVAGLMRLDVEFSTTGIEDAKTEKKSYVLIDKIEKVWQKEIVLVELNDNDITLQVPRTVYAMEWPTGMTNKEVVAFYKTVREVRKLAKR